jgi:hypothetical protein
MTQYKLKPKLLLLIFAAFAVVAPMTMAGANPPDKWELETVESLHFGSESIPAFVYDAPPPSCLDARGFTVFDDCPDVKWLCPNGITHGALTRLARDISYNRAVLGFEARDTMCLNTGVLSAVPNPQLPPTPTPTSVPVTQPIPSFTG